MSRLLVAFAALLVAPSAVHAGLPVGAPIDVPYRVVRSAIGAAKAPATDAALADPDAALARVTPNPGGSAQSFALRVAESSGPVSIRIHDLAGRLVWSRDLAGLAPGVHRVVWDGLDDQGQRAPGAIYLARVRDADGARGIKLVRLP